MSGIVVYKNGESKVIDSKRVKRFLDEGWTTDQQPKWSASVEATADVIEPTPEEEEVQNEESEDEYAWNDEAEVEGHIEDEDESEDE